MPRTCPAPPSRSSTRIRFTATTRAAERTSCSVTARCTSSPAASTRPVIRPYATLAAAKWATTGDCLQGIEECGLARANGLRVAALLARLRWLRQEINRPVDCRLEVVPPEGAAH